MDFDLRKLLILIMFLFIMTIVSVRLCYPADLGVGVGQRGVQVTELNWRSINYAHHSGDGDVDIVSLRLTYRKPVGAFEIGLFAGIGYGWASGNPQDIEMSIIGHWGGELSYRAVGIRLSHWSNPFANSEYGHNLVSIFYRW